MVLKDMGAKVSIGFIWHRIGTVEDAYKHHTVSLGSIKDEKSLTNLPASSFSKRTMQYGVSKLICLMLWLLIVYVREGGTYCTEQ
jgi:hypothetical protein